MTTTTTANGLVRNAAPVSAPTIAALCAALEQVLGVAPAPPAEVVLRWGDTSIEVAWPAAPPAVAGRRTDVSALRAVLHRFLGSVAAGPVILIGNSMGG